MVFCQYSQNLHKKATHINHSQIKHLLFTETLWHVPALDGLSYLDIFSVNEFLQFDHGNPENLNTSHVVTRVFFQSI